MFRVYGARAQSTLASTFQPTTSAILSQTLKAVTNASSLPGIQHHWPLAGREETSSTLADVAAHLEDPFRIVVAGEFNAGKSSLINALLGSDVLASGVTPTTQTINILEYAQEKEEEGGDSATPSRGSAALMATAEEDVRVLKVHAPFLRDVSIVDTPGTNAVVEHHEAIAKHFVPRSDLVLFLTTLDKSMSHSERQFLSLIRSYGKKVIGVVNKVDIAGNDHDALATVLSFVRDQMAALLSGVAPSAIPLFPLSTKTRQGLPELRAYLDNMASSDERLFLKLDAPLGVAAREIATASAAIDAGKSRPQALLDRTAKKVHRAIQRHADDAALAVSSSSARVGNPLFRVAEAGDAFFDSTVSFPSILFRSSSSIASDFSSRVVGSVYDDVYRNAKRVADSSRRSNAALLAEVSSILHKAQDYARKRGLDLPAPHTRRMASSSTTTTTSSSSFSSASDSSEMAASIASVVKAKLVDRGDAFAKAASAGGIQLLIAEGGFAATGTLASIVSDMVFIPWVGTAAVMAAAALSFAPMKKARLAAAFRSDLTRLRTELETRVQDEMASAVEQAAADAHLHARPLLGALDDIVAAYDEAGLDFADLAAQVSDLRSRLQHALPQAAASAKQ